MFNYNREEWKTKQGYKLKARVAAYNQLGAIINEWTPKLKALLAPWVGQKVTLATGGRPNKLKAELDKLPLPCTPQVHMYWEFSNYNIRVGVRVSVSHMGESQSAEGSIYVGDMEHDSYHLKKLYDNFEPWKTNYTVADVEAKRAAFEAAKDVYEKAKSALHPFGEREN